MTIQRMIELLEIEHECMLRGAHDDCDRNCANCELVQDDGDLHEMYTNVIALLKEKKAEIERMKGEGKSPTWKKGKAFCGNCGGCLENKEMFSSYHVSSIRFCKWCGAPVDWSNG